MFRFLFFAQQLQLNVYLLYHFSTGYFLPNCYNKIMENNNTGTYIYDKKLQKMVKVSDRIPSAQKRHHSCNGCCGHCGCNEN